MDGQIPRKAGITGGVLILASGIVSALLGLRWERSSTSPTRAAASRFSLLGRVVQAD